MIAVVKPSFWITSFGVVVNHSIILVFAGEAVCVVIASLAVVGTVGTKVLIGTLACKLGKTHIQTKIVSAQIVWVVAAEAISKVQTDHTLGEAGSTY